MKKDLDLQTVTITLDGREVSGSPGMTILELACESGVGIPTLCHDPHLSPVGACRVCLVEDERTGAMLASCIAPIAPGMIINTRSTRVMEHRKTVVELMLASHPDSCFVCDKGNRCQLRQIASDMGIGLLELQRIPQIATIEEVNPFLERDLSKCILCAKCIRACQELVVEGAIDYFQRGFSARPATLGNLPMETSECIFCGTCVALCPTGALTETEKPYRGTSRTTVQTTCPFCGCGCSICLEVKDDRIVRVTPGQEDSVNKGTLCVRGSYGCDFVHSPDRLTKPLVRDNGAFKAVPWEEALALVGARFRQIGHEYGGGSLAVLGSSKCTNEENYLLQRFARTVLGTNSIDNGGRLYNSASRAGLGSSIGSCGTTHSLSELEQSEAIIVIGADPSSSAPAVAYALKRAVKSQGARLVLIDPRKTKLSSFAYLCLQPKPGTDVALLNGLAKVVLDEGLLDEEFVARRTDNFEAFTKSLAAYTLERVAKTTGVPGREIHSAARLYAAATRAAIIYGTGITQYPSGTDGVKALANLALLTGNISHGGGGIYALQRENNGQGANDMGTLPDLLPGYQAVADAQLRRGFEQRWGASLPADSGLTALEIIQQATEGKIRGMYIVGENPALSFPHSTLVAKALASLDFLVVQDLFLTETAKLANVVLPAASFAEKEGTFTNFEGRVRQVQQAVKPLGESLPDWEIILRLAATMESPMPYSSPWEVMGEIADSCQLPAYSSYRDAGTAGSETNRLHQTEPNSIGLGRTHANQFLKGFARFCPVECVSPSVPKKSYPFTLLIRATAYHFGAGSRSSRASRLKRFSPEAFVELGESDAKELGISNGDKVKIRSPVGAVSATAKITGALPKGVLSIPASFPETPVNQLFDIALDPEVKTPSLKACNVRIEGVSWRE